GRGSEQSGSVVSHRQAVANDASGGDGLHYADAERTYFEGKGECASDRGAAGARTGSADDEAMRHRQPVPMNRAVRSTSATRRRRQTERRQRFSTASTSSC